MSSSDDIFCMFDNESKKLSDVINTATTKSNLSISEIIDTYYKVINISSMITMLKQQINVDSQKILLDKILETEKIISGKFNSEIHPVIMAKLGKSILETTTALQSGTEQRSRENIENEAKFFEELRQKMSTKEFVEQYDKGLSDD